MFSYTHSPKWQDLTVTTLNYSPYHTVIFFVSFSINRIFRKNPKGFSLLSCPQALLVVDRENTWLSPSFPFFFVGERREEGSSHLFIFVPLTYFCKPDPPPNYNHPQPFSNTTAIPSEANHKPIRLSMMPSNAVTNASSAAFKGSDFTDTHGNRMVRTRHVWAVVMFFQWRTL